jgi:hypothetical protein
LDKPWSGHLPLMFYFFIYISFEFFVAVQNSKPIIPNSCQDAAFVYVCGMLTSFLTRRSPENAGAMQFKFRGRLRGSSMHKRFEDGLCIIFCKGFVLKQKRTSQ